MENQRVDKWLWCARFYKTRGLAADAVKGGKVEINGGRAKPARTLRIGDVIVVRRQPYSYEIEVLNLTQQRVAAPATVTLYRETESSKQQREALRETMKMSGVADMRRHAKLSKKERRAHERLKRSF